MEQDEVGPRWLAKPDVADCVCTSVRENAEMLYDLHAFVAMPNHVHILITPRRELAEITKRIKGRSARRANAILGRTGQAFWQDESFDHWVRSPSEFGKIVEYIEQNPVRAGLVPSVELWPFSSASGRLTA